MERITVTAVWPAVDDVLAATAGRMRLRHEREKAAPEVVPDARGPLACLWPLAMSAAAWLRDADRTLLRQCSSEKCILFFYDTTRNHSRRWCSMATCGNREKVRAFQRRRRGESR